MESDVPAKEQFPASQFRLPIVLVELQGNLAFLWAEDDAKLAHAGKVPDLSNVTDLHPQFVMIAKGARRELDVFFLGGDNNNQPLFPMKRV